MTSGSRDPGRPNNPLFNSNTLKLGTFCTNGQAAANTLVPEAYQATWASSVATARLADDAGLEAIVPYARWKPYQDGKPDHPSGDGHGSRIAGRRALRRRRGMRRSSRPRTRRPSIRSWRPSNAPPSI